ncbi:MAG: CoA pyrophosphatase [Candidatus Latescibacterota bacterium]
MAPSHRETIDPDEARKRPHREGAVLVMLYPGQSGPSTLFTVRRADLNDHAGQISFPGGRREAGERLETTATREAEEEVGIGRDEIEVVGELTPLYIPPSRYIVHPFVAAAASRPDFRLQESEVARIIEVPLADLQDPANRRSEIWKIRDEESRVPCFRIGGERIWGATAMIMNELLAVISEQ